MGEIGGKKWCCSGMLIELLLVDVVSGSIGSGLEKQTGATGLLFPKRLFIGTLLELMRSV